MEGGLALRVHTAQRRALGSGLVRGCPGIDVGRGSIVMMIVRLGGPHYTRGDADDDYG